MNLLTITKMNWTVSTSKLLTSRTPLYIAIHYTGAVGSVKGTAINTCKYWKNNPKIQASADFVCDDGMTAQYTPDIAKYYCWAIGGKASKNKTTTLSGTMNGKATNKNTVSIEICCRKKSTKTKNASDNDWYFTEESLNQAIMLTKYLMVTFNIPISNVIMHHSVTGKLCPSMWCINESRLAEYYSFKQRIIDCAMPTVSFINYGTNEYYKDTTKPTTSTNVSTPTISNINSTVHIYNGVDLSPVFNANYYADKYADLKAAYGYNNDLLFKHFCLAGMNEARQGTSTFNSVTYRHSYPDLDAQFGDKWMKYYAHYCTTGIKEGRKGN